jgi:hypothetical protein
MMYGYTTLKGEVGKATDHELCHTLLNELKGEARKSS